MWAYTKFIYSYTPFQLQKERKTDSVKIQTAQKQISNVQRRDLFTFIKAVFGMILLLHSTFVLVLV